MFSFKVTKGTEYLNSVFNDSISTLFSTLIANWPKKDQAECLRKYILSSDQSI
jgi:hypothetical protein